jgi:hypothetical protein
MTRPVTFMEINSPDLERSSIFFSAAFGWELQPFTSPDYLVASSGDGPGSTPRYSHRGTARRGRSLSCGWSRWRTLRTGCGHTAGRSSSSRSPSPEWAAAAMSSTQRACSSVCTSTTRAPDPRLARDSPPLLEWSDCAVRHHRGSPRGPAAMMSVDGAT